MLAKGKGGIWFAGYVREMTISLFNRFDSAAYTDADLCARAFLFRIKSRRAVFLKNLEWWTLKKADQTFALGECWNLYGEISKESENSWLKGHGITW